MNLSRPTFFSAFCGLALMLGGCFLMPPGMKSKPETSSRGADSVLINADKRTDDGAETWDARIDRIDSLREPDSAASALYQLSLQNYLALDSADSKADEVRLLLGNHFFNREKYDSALVIYKRILAGNPQASIREEASQMVAQSFVLLGDPEKAQEWYRNDLREGDSVSRQDARDRLAQALYLQAEKAEKLKKYALAAKYYGDVTRTFPLAQVSPIALYNCGVLREKLQDWPKALAAYHQFTQIYYQNPMLPRVLFRQAKTKEMLGDWLGAADGYVKLGKTYPNSEHAEPALYNAGFAFLNGNDIENAALAFEYYAERYPQGTESPNLLFKAVEMRSEMKQWARVEELQAQFERRYGRDRNRRIQALCLAGMASYHQGKVADAKKRLGLAAAEFRQLGDGNAQARLYAAQAQFTLAEMAAADAKEEELRESHWDSDLNRKTELLKTAVGEYLKAVDYRIAQWALRSAYSLGELFEDYGNDIGRTRFGPGKNAAQTVERAIQNLETMGSAWLEAADHFSQADEIGKKQNIHDKYTLEARFLPAKLSSRYLKSLASLWQGVARIWPVRGLPAQKPVRENMDKFAYLAALVSQAVQVTDGFLKIEVLVSDSDSAADSSTHVLKSGVATIRDSLAEVPVRLLTDLGRQYAGLLDTVRSVALPADSLEAFFFQAKLIREGLQSIEKAAIEVHEAGMQVAHSRGLDSSPWTDSLRLGLGKLLYQAAYGRGLLAERALGHPPIPKDAPDAARKTFIPKFDEIGYQLKDESLAGYRDIVQRMEKSEVDTLTAELALVQLFAVQPDTWGRATAVADASGASHPAVDTAVLLPFQPWNQKAMTMDRWKYLKTFDFIVPHLSL